MMICVVRSFINSMLVPTYTAHLTCHTEFDEGSFAVKGTRMTQCLVESLLVPSFLRILVYVWPRGDHHDCAEMRLDGSSMTRLGLDFDFYEHT